MRRELAYGLRAVRARPVWKLLAWSVPEALATAMMGVAVARFVDEGVLAGRPLVGFAWLGALLATVLLSAAGSGQVLHNVGRLVEPVRDDLVERVVRGALRNGVAGRNDDAVIARLTRQVEIVRDTLAGIIMVLRGFLMTLTATVGGLLSIAPGVTVLVLPPLLAGVAMLLISLRFAAGRFRASVVAEERLSGTGTALFGAAKDIIASGAERFAAGTAAGPIRDQADAERAMIGVSVLRAAAFVIGGWLPLLIVLLAAPNLVAHGLTAGAVLGSLTFILFGVQPALNRLISGLGSSGLRFAVTLGRILKASTVDEHAAAEAATGPGYDIVLDRVTFAYGPHSEPIVDRLSLAIPAGDHLAVVGPSGIGKSTLAGLLCGVLRPTGGHVRTAGASSGALTPAQRARLFVLIPQEAYVFSGSLWSNLTYLCPTASADQVTTAIAALGADQLITEIGGLGADVAPDRLSAGQRQMIALVRAYLSPAPVAVLDEATCHLDPAADRRVEAAFAARPGTLVVIAHRLSSAARAQRVLVIDGVRADVGLHAELLDRSELYRQLWNHWRSQPAGLAGGADGLDARTGAGLGQYPGEMIADGSLAQEQLLRDIPGGQPGVDQAEDLPLPLGQRIAAGGQRGQGQRAVEDGLAGQHTMDCVD